MNIGSTNLYGKFRAEVINVADPLLRGRILVKCPKVLNNHELGWAESCFTPGQFSLPRKGDFVWIEFEEGDVHMPIWVGIMPTRAYVRDYLLTGTGAYDPNTAVLRANQHGGIRFYSRNKAGANRMTIIDGAGSYIQLDSKTGDINVKPINNFNEK